jgi:hypothetical protein
LINPLTAFSQVFKPKPCLKAGGKYIFSSSLRTPSAYGGLGIGSLYTTSSKPKGKSDDFFQKVYSDKSANNPFFIVNNFFKQYPNPELANLDYKLINTILCNHTSCHRPPQHRRVSSNGGVSVIRNKIGVSVGVAFAYPTRVYTSYNASLASLGIKTYSTNAIVINPLMLDFFTNLIQEDTGEIIVIKLPDGRKVTISREFTEWFRGFTDAEGSFSLTISSNRYSFKFRILLHLNDIEVLYYIRNILGIGNIYISKTNSAVTYNVVNKDGILIILAIFAKYNLNTTKHLNFLALAQAFWLYHINDKSNDLKDIKLQIDKIKSSMNKNRTDFVMPSSHRFNISRYWFLGFTEGDGSFTYTRSSGTLYYKLYQKGDKDLFNAIIA